MSERIRQFASDNWAGVCPEAQRALDEAGAGHAPSYGDDSWTARAGELVRGVFETDCESYFVFGGTAANALALAAFCRSHHAVLCHEHAHVHVAECGAPEFFSRGAKLVPLPGAFGKLTPRDLELAVERHHPVHEPKPRAVSISQATEFGTVYSRAELQALGRAARALGLGVHMDGARFANAVVSLGVRPAELANEAGVDVLSFGGVKNGGMLGELVVFFNRELAREFAYLRKQSGQLCAKMRFLAAPWVGMLTDGAWLRHAAHANAMARRLSAGLASIPEAPVRFPVETNAVFVELPPAAVARLAAAGFELPRLGSTNLRRLMCAWDTRAEDVDDLLCVMAGA